MKKLFVIIFSALACGIYAQNNTHFLKFKLADGQHLTGKLELPVETGSIKELVIYVHGTGPNTYLNKRKIGGKELNYFDLFSGEINKMGVAFFSYNRRGCYLSNTPPLYDSVSKIEYAKYLPETEADDLGRVIKELKKRKELNKAKIVLLGWSEGTIISSLIALKKENKVDALLLAGYAHEKMIDLISWQYSGESAMINFRKYFDADSNKIITKNEYSADSENVSRFREKALRGVPFETFDVTRDSLISVEDFAVLNKAAKDQILNAFEKNDDEWIWNNYFRVTSNWFHAHNKLEPNKERMLKLEMPIFIFHGYEDANTPIEVAFDLERSFKEANKNNLHCNYFKGHNHDLNYTDWPLKGVVSPGIEKIFETINLLQLK